MIFQALDNKSDCKRIYCNGKIHNKFIEDLTGTWEFTKDSPSDVEYAYLYCGGKTLSDVCPDFLQNEWAQSSNKLKAYLNSFMQAKIDLNQHCFYDLVPEHFLLNFYKVKSEITNYVIKNHHKPKNYDFLLKLSGEVEKIKNRPLNVDITRLNKFKHNLATRNFLKKMKKTKKLVNYNIFGTKTGRLTTRPDTFPILTLKKEYRNILKPNNDLYIELDYNAAELRTLLALCDKEQPKEDIHEWNAKNIFRGLQSRKEAKERIFAWLYNPDSKDYLANRAYDKTSVKEKYWDGKIVTTPFDRQIEADEFHALNYLIQSTTSDLVLKQMIKVANLLKGKKSHIAFIIHDSVVIDFAEEDRNLISNIIETFKATEFGEYKVSVHAGENFGELKKII